MYAVKTSQGHPFGRRSECVANLLTESVVTECHLQVLVPKWVQLHSTLVMWGYAELVIVPGLRRHLHR